MPIKIVITNVLLFQIGWFACVLGGAEDKVVLGCAVATGIICYHLYRTKNILNESRLLILALIIGLCFESIITSLGLAIYRHGQVTDWIAPLWIILMWPLFATTLNVSMRWMKGLNPFLNALLGGLLAPLAYYAGNRLGAVDYENIMLSLSIIALSWAILLPGLISFSIQNDGYRVADAMADNKRDARYV